MEVIWKGSSAMYRIGICDDQKGTCEELEKMTRHFFDIQREKTEIEIFYSGNIFMDYLDQGNWFHLLFLDIELTSSNGIEIGNYIRKNLKDEQVEIVYISSKTHYAMDLFQCRPLDFLVKPLKYSEVSRSLETMKKRHIINKKIFVYSSDKTIKRIPVENIMYCISENKQITMTLHTGEHIRFRGKLSDTANKLPDTTFIQIHKSYLINLNYISEYSADKVKMTDGTVLGISPSKKKEVKAKFMQYELL